MTGLLNDSIREQVRGVFEELQNPVEILLFVRQNECEYCKDIQVLLEEVADLSDMVNVTVYDFDENRVVAEQYKVDKVPGFTVTAKVGENLVDYGIRFYGIPSGHEFTSLINDVVLVSSRQPSLSEETMNYLKELRQPVHLQVFVTPTCPYCPRAVVLAHQMALASDLVQADGIEAFEFQELAEKYFVSGVPQTTINDGAGTLIGAGPEANLLEEIKRALAEIP